MHPLPPRIFFHDLRSRSLIRRFMMSFFDFFIRLFLLIVVVVVVRVKKCTVRNLARGYAEKLKNRKSLKRRDPASAEAPARQEKR